MPSPESQQGEIRPKLEKVRYEYLFKKRQISTKEKYNIKGERALII